MASTPADGSEDVNDFLQRIKELRDTQDQEDEERNRKLEEDILQGRKERQARRAERARSISPTKSSPANTPIASRQATIQSSGLSETLSPVIDPNKGSDVRRDNALHDAMDSLTGSPTKENFAPGDEPQDTADIKRKTPINASPSSAMPSRNSPLSWQRRPNSQATERPRTRPLSMVATENAARSPRATPEPSLESAVDPILSRDQIAQSLASKDPAWFRQSAESRGGTSPAYRKNQVEDQDRSDHGSKSAGVQMPGMSSESSRSEQGEERPVDRISSPSRSSAGSGSAFGSRSSGIGSPVPLTSAQRFDPLNPESIGEVRGLAMSPSQGRISPDRLDRPASPTKGMGGFVQSAMMKRSDSVSKRWSVQSPPGLKRGDSVASNRSSQETTALANIVNTSIGSSRPSSLSRDNSPRPLSRPNSSHSNATITQDGRPGTSSSMRSSMTASTTNDGFVKPSLPASRSQTPQDTKTKQETPSREEATTPPSSPLKTTDTKRWSPTKSSWLESALNKPESPKPKPVPPPQQPAWMSEINKAKQKGSIDLGRDSAVSHKHEVSIGGLMRLPPPGGLSKPISIGGLPAGFSSGAASKGRSENTSTTAPSKAESTDAASPAPATNIRSPPAFSKVKPETPPKKDFRANLKPRQLPVDSGKEEPEFKNVFGQLKRTKTQNYVAPDELKNNITRGKAALNLTGGPKKTERKDEFKDAILKKKEDFKKTQLEGKGVTRSASGGLQETTLPEALAKRKALGKPDSITEASSIQETTKPSFSSKEVDAPSKLQGKDAVGSKLAGRFNPALAGLLARGPPSMASDTSRSDSPVSSRTVSMSTSTTNDTSEPGPQLTHMTKGRARGPRRKAPSTVATKATEPVEAEERKTAEKEPEASVKSRNTATLSIMQKSTVSPPDSSLRTDFENPISQPSSPRKLDLKRRSQFLQEASDKGNQGEPQANVPRPLSPTKKAATIENHLETKETGSEPVSSPTIRAKPEAPIKSSSLTSKTNDRTAVTQRVELQETMKLKPSPPTKTNTSNFESLKDPANVEKSSVTSKDPPIPAKDRKVTATDATTPVSVRNVAAIWDRPMNQTPANPPRSRSPIKLPTHDDEKAAMVGAGLRSASPVKSKAAVGLGLQTTSEFGSSRPLPTPPVKGPISPPPSVGLISSTTATKLNTSPVPQTSEASRLVDEFFGQHDASPDFVADTAAILAARPDEGHSVKTLRSNLYQFYNDGKKQLVPTHQERLLFEENMYICIHTFGSAAGKKVTEVYFWLGDEVPATAVLGADIFAQREAKAAGGTLIKIRQGKETAEFFQGLGGIIIIRRGSSNKYDSLAPHILCGRNHFGQIAFDEVDYSAASLCSGFPYLILTQAGKSYLWKGKGSGIDELSCARLIGMDFGLTGEVEEIDEGNESSSFLQIFGSGSKIPKSADHWRMKPNYSKYCGRLFCADSTAKSQIVEISPFNQSDISQSNIYILDAFFEIYIIVGCQAQAQFASFSNALMFAQEYGILAAGMEDRPYVPVTTVILEGVPKDMKSVFRKWSDGLTPTIMKPLSPGLQRGRSLRVVPLTAALEATRRPS